MGLSSCCFAHFFIVLNFLKEKAAEILAIQMFFFEFDLDLFGGASLLFSLLNFAEEGVVEGFVHRDSKVRVEYQDFLK